MSNKEGFKNCISDFKRQNIASTTKLQFERLQSVGHEQNLVKKKKKKSIKFFYIYMVGDTVYASMRMYILLYSKKFVNEANT